MNRKLYNRPITVIMIMLTLIIFGIVSIPRLKMELLPNLKKCTLSVFTIYPASEAKHVEKNITEKLKETCSSLSGIAGIFSESINGASLLKLTFKNGENLSATSSELREKIDRIINTMPQSSSRPSVYNSITDSEPFMLVSINSSKKDNIYNNINTINKNLIPEIMKIDGVSKIKKYGFKNKSVFIILNPAKLIQYGIEYKELYQRISQAGFDIPLGFLKTDRQKFEISIDNKFESIRDISEIRFTYENGKYIELGEISEIKYTFNEDENTAISSNGKSLFLHILKRDNIDSVKLHRKIKSLFSKFQKENPNIEINIFHSSSYNILSSIKNLTLSIIISAIAVAAVIIIFTGDRKRSACLLTLIPVTITVIFFIMHIFKLSLNIISMSGISLSIGLLIDNGIIISNAWFANPKKHEENISIAAKSLRSSSITTIIIFLPVLFSSGTSGSIFRDLGIIITGGLIVSYFSAVYLLPAIFLLLNRKDDRKEILKKRNLFSEKNLIEKYRKLYSKNDKCSLKKKIITTTGILCLIIFFFPKYQIFPETNAGYYKIRIPFEKNISHRALLNKADPLIKYFQKRNMAFLMTAGMNTEEADDLFSKDIRPYTLLLRIKTNPDDLKELQSFLKIHNFENSIKELTPLKNCGTSSFLEKNEYYFLGNLLLFQKVKKDIENKFTVTISEKRESNFLKKIKLNNWMHSLSKIKTENFSSFLKFLFSGEICGEMTINNIKTPVKIISGADSANFLNNFYFKENVPYLMRNLITNIETAPKEVIQKINGKEVHIIQLSGTSHNIKNSVTFLKKLNLITKTTEENLLIEEFNNIITLSILSLILILMFLCSYFESFKAGAAAASVIPFSIIAAAGALILTGGSFNLISITGTALLSGITVNSTILITDAYLNSKTDSPYTCAEKRLRPLLMTSLTTIISMLPLLFGGEGAELQKPMAAVIIGGLLITVLYVLFIYPQILYKMVKRNE